MKKRLWICEREPKYFESLEPAELNMIAKFPFSVQELEECLVWIENADKDMPDLIETVDQGEKVIKELREEWKVVKSLKKKLQTLIKELKK